jgi:hypothetical protein
MQVWRDADGSLLVEMDGQVYHHLNEVRDRDVARRLLDIINRLVAFSKDKAAQPELPASKPDESALASSLPAGEPAQGLSQRLQQQAEAPRRISRLTADPVPFRRRSAADQQNITLDLAGEIDQWLQGRIQTQPELSHRYIHVSSAADGALRFQVDGAHYAAVDDIPEPGVRALLRAAIKDWEAQR